MHGFGSSQSHNMLETLVVIAMGLNGSNRWTIHQLPLFIRTDTQVKGLAPRLCPPRPVQSIATDLGSVAGAQFLCSGITSTYIPAV